MNYGAGLGIDYSLIENNEFFYEEELRNMDWNGAKRCSVMRITSRIGLFEDQNDLTLDFNRWTPKELR